MNRVYIKFLILISLLWTLSYSNTSIQNKVSVEVYPNPFNAVIHIIANANFDISYEKFVVQIFNLQGRMISNLRTNNYDMKKTEEKIILWDACRVPSGLYIANINIGGKIFKKKLVLLK